MALEERIVEIIGERNEHCTLDDQWCYHDVCTAKAVVKDPTIAWGLELVAQAEAGKLVMLDANQRPPMPMGREGIGPEHGKFNDSVATQNSMLGSGFQRVVPIKSPLEPTEQTTPEEVRP